MKKRFKNIESITDRKTYEAVKACMNAALAFHRKPNEKRLQSTPARRTFGSISSVIPIHMAYRRFI